MPRIGVNRIARAKKAIDLLRAAVSVFPTSEQITAASKTLAELATYLQQAEERIRRLPTQGDFQFLVDGLTKLDELLANAEGSPSLSAALGLGKPHVHRPLNTRSVDPSHAQELISSMGDLTLDQLRDALASEHRHSMADLRILAEYLGIRGQARMARETLVQRIVTAIANTKGYEILRTPGTERADSPNPASS